MGMLLYSTLFTSMALLWGVKLKLKKDEEAASRKGSMVVNEAKTSFIASDNVISEG